MTWNCGCWWAVAAVDDDRRFALVHQYRHPLGRRLRELPAGLLDASHEDPLTIAKRELHEEAGPTATEWRLLVDTASSPGFSDESVRTYLATGLPHVERPHASDEEDLTLQWWSLEDATDKVLAGEIVNASAAAGVLAAYGDRREAHPPGRHAVAGSANRVRAAAGQQMTTDAAFAPRVRVASQLDGQAASTGSCRLAGPRSRRSTRTSYGARPELARRQAVAAERMAGRAGCRRTRGNFIGRVAAHPAAFVRHSPARRWRRCSRLARTSRPRVGHDHADLHVGHVHSLREVRAGAHP